MKYYVSKRSYPSSKIFKIENDKIFQFDRDGWQLEKYISYDDLMLLPLETIMSNYNNQSYWYKELLIPMYEKEKFYNDLLNEENK